MICPHCGEETPVAEDSCVHCGQNVQVTAGSVFDVQPTEEDTGTDWGPRLVRSAVGLVVLAAVLGFGARFLRNRPLAKNEVEAPEVSLPEVPVPQPKPPDDLPQPPLIEPVAVELPTAIPVPRVAFGSRDPRVRQLFLERNGGGPDTEAAVKAGLEWLARTQAEDGGWDYKEFGVSDKHQQGQDHRVGVSGLALLAFLGAGHHHEGDGPFQEPVDKAVRYLLGAQGDNGAFPGAMYHQGICTMALAEAYGLSGDTSLLEPTRRAVEAIAAAQNQSGGWDYGHSPHSARGDTSVTGWQIMALKSARKVGIAFPDTVYERAIEFLDEVSRDTGDIGYEVGGDREWRTTSALTAAGLNAYLFMGVEDDDPRVQKAVGILLNHLPERPRATPSGWKPRADIYFWYHGALALSRLGGQEWTLWNNRLKPILLHLQHKEGEHKGRWRTAGDRWSDRAGDVYFTSLAIMALEVYYRYD